MANFVRVVVPGATGKGVRTNDDAGTAECAWLGAKRWRRLLTLDGTYLHGSTKYEVSIVVADRVVQRTT